MDTLIVIKYDIYQDGYDFLLMEPNEKEDINYKTNDKMNEEAEKVAKVIEGLTKTDLWEKLKKLLMWGIPTLFEEYILKIPYGLKEDEIKDLLINFYKDILGKHEVN